MFTSDTNSHPIIISSAAFRSVIEHNFDSFVKMTSQWVIVFRVFQDIAIVWEEIVTKLLTYTFIH